MQHGVAYHEKLGQLFCDNKASDILDMLLAECDEAGAEIRMHTSIEQIERTESGYLLQTSGGQFACQSLVIATGACRSRPWAPPGSATRSAPVWPHLLPTRAGLVPFTITEPQLKALCSELSGTSLDCTATCNGTSFRENLLFTHRGLSGPAILQISSFWEAGDTVEINLLPDRDALTWLQQMQTERANAELKTVLGEVFTRKLANLLAEQWFESCPMKQYTPQNWRRLPRSWPTGRWCLRAPRATAPPK